MNETNMRMTGTPTPDDDPEQTLSPADPGTGRRDPWAGRLATPGSMRPGTFAEGEESQPEADAEERLMHRGSFASGHEEKPEEDAERRVHARGGFAVGGEKAPEQDARDREHPGSFADSDPNE